MTGHKNLLLPNLMDSDRNIVKIMTLNLRFGLADDGSNNWAQRCKAYPALLNSFPCDFYAFQEANDFQIEFLGAQLKGYDHIGQRQPAPDYWQSNVIFFHPDWKCVSYEHFYLSNTPEVPSKFSQSRWPRQCTLGIFKGRHRSLICINTHFDFDPEVQRASARLIQERLLQYSLQLPVLLAGDFNAAPSSSCYDVFTSGCKPGAEFRNAFDPSTRKGTHHGFKGRSDGAPIDWILYRGSLEVNAARMVTEKFNGRYPSDHFPLAATFGWLDAG